MALYTSFFSHPSRSYHQYQSFWYLTYSSAPPPKPSMATFIAMETCELDHKLISKLFDLPSVGKLT